MTEREHETEGEERGPATGDELLERDRLPVLRCPEKPA